ncbi:MAG: hypothetical protein IPH45_19465 [Bacteroidales bacterium]|nr:hypothetical protein [Bacteroidales bacterium]
MTVLPNPNNISLNPNGMLDHPFTVTNAGTGLLTGLLHWVRCYRLVQYAVFNRNSCSFNPG